MRVYSMKHVSSFLGISKRMIKEALYNEEVITSSWAVLDDKGLVVELVKNKDGVEITKLLITNKGIDFLDKEVHNV